MRSNNAKMRSNDAKRRVSPLTLSHNTQGSSVALKQPAWVFFSFHFQLFPAFNNGQTVRLVTLHTPSPPHHYQHHHLVRYQEENSLGSSCFPLRHIAPLRRSSLVTFPQPRPSNTPATACSRSDSLKATKGARRFTVNFAESRGNLREPGGANQRNRPSFEMLLLLP